MSSLSLSPRCHEPASADDDGEAEKDESLPEDEDDEEEDPLSSSSSSAPDEDSSPSPPSLSEDTFPIVVVAIRRERGTRLGGSGLGHMCAAGGAAEVVVATAVV